MKKTSASPFRVALAHDWLVGLRGGERVLDRLARVYGPTALYTLVADGRPVTDAISACRVITSPLQRFPRASGAWRRAYLPLMPWAVGRLRVRDCDLLISTSSAVMKSIRPPAAAPHLCYCHSPARYIWEQTDDYAVGRGGRLRRAGLGLVSRRFQAWDRRTAATVTRFLANSTHTASRIERCYGRTAHVVFPPVRTNEMTPDPTVAREDWYLVVAALEPYKRTDLVVEAARRAGFAVRIAGRGSQFDALRAMGGTSVDWLGYVTDDAVLDLYRRARGLIFPQVEDFGIVAAEALACGCPVIAFDAGGARDIVPDDVGLRFDAQTVDGVIDAVRRFERRSFDVATIRASALRFSEATFDAAIAAHVADLRSGADDRIEA